MLLILGQGTRSDQRLCNDNRQLNEDELKIAGMIILLIMALSLFIFLSLWRLRNAVAGRAKVQFRAHRPYALYRIEYRIKNNPYQNLVTLMLRNIITNR